MVSVSLEYWVFWRNLNHFCRSTCLQNVLELETNEHIEVIKSIVLRNFFQPFKNRYTTAKCFSPNFNELLHLIVRAIFKAEPIFSFWTCSTAKSVVVFDASQYDAHLLPSIRYIAWLPPWLVHWWLMSSNRHWTPSGDNRRPVIRCLKIQAKCKQ